VTVSGPEGEVLSSVSTTDPDVICHDAGHATWLCQSTRDAETFDLEVQSPGYQSQPVHQDVPRATGVKSECCPSCEFGPRYVEVRLTPL
jgi:hypothetical protein